MNSLVQHAAQATSDGNRLPVAAIKTANLGLEKHALLPQTGTKDKHVTSFAFKSKCKE